MGTEFALVCDATGEAYDLGKGPWYEWADGRRHLYDDAVGPPRSRSDVDALLAYWMEGWALGVQPAWSAAVNEAIWSFVEAHPGARVVSDSSGDHVWDDWDARPDLSDHVQSLRASGSRIYRQVGSRYDHDAFLSGTLGRILTVVSTKEGRS